MDYSIILLNNSLLHFEYCLENVLRINKLKLCMKRIRRYLSYVITKNIDIVERQLLISNVEDTHSAEEIKKMWEYCNSYDKSIVEYVEKVRKKEYVKPLEIGTISDKASKDIQDITGIITLGNKVILDKNTIQHIDKRHGINGIADHSMADDSTLSRIRYVLNNYDGIKKGRGTKYIRLTDGQMAPTVVFYKQINGTFYVVEAVTNAKSKKNRVVSAYISEQRPI